MRAIGLAAVLAAFVTFSSAQGAEMSAEDKAVLDMLSPELQEEVKSRLGDGNTVRGVLETMLLNDISEMAVTNSIQAVDLEEGVAIVERADGEIDTVYFETMTLEIKE